MSYFSTEKARRTTPQLPVRAAHNLLRFLLRFRYPVSLPEDIAIALGLELSNYMSFDQVLERLTHPSSPPLRLQRFMSRDGAEECFESAVRQEKFRRRTLCSYYFNKGWLEFELRFDEQARLRRLYLHHRSLSADRGVEIPLNS